MPDSETTLRCVVCEGAMRRLLFILILSLTTSTTRVLLAGDLPDSTRTPGVPNPDVTQENIKETVCKAGWTKTIRPKTKYTNDLKVKQIAEYGYSDKSPNAYEEDHLISLQLGGHPTDPRN